MKKFMKEFKEFAFKGNMIDLAIGMIIGGAFTGLVKAVVADIFMPIISLFTGKIDFANMFIPLAGQTTKVYAEAAEEGAVIAYGAFITEFIQFIAMAVVVFIFVKKVNAWRTAHEEPKKEEPAKTKVCPFCKQEISIDAVRCPHCTSELQK